MHFYNGGFVYRSAVEEEKVAAAARMLHGVLDEVDDCRALKLRETTETKVT